MNNFANHLIQCCDRYLGRSYSYARFPKKILVLIQLLYSGSESAVPFGSALSKYFFAAPYVGQGCVLDPSLFNVCIEQVLEKTITHAF